MEIVLAFGAFYKGEGKREKGNFVWFGCSSVESGSCVMSGVGEGEASKMGAGWCTRRLSA